MNPAKALAERYYNNLLPSGELFFKGHPKTLHLFKLTLEAKKDAIVKIYEEGILDSGLSKDSIREINTYIENKPKDFEKFESFVVSTLAQRVSDYLTNIMSV